MRGKKLCLLPVTYFVDYQQRLTLPQPVCSLPHWHRQISYATSKKPLFPILCAAIFSTILYQQGRLAHVPGQTPLPNSGVASGCTMASPSTMLKKSTRPRYLLASSLTQHNYVRPSRYLLASSLTQVSSFLMGAYINTPPPLYPLPPKTQRLKFCVTLVPIVEEETNDSHDSTYSAPMTSLTC